MSSPAPPPLPPQPEIPASPQSSGKKTCLIVAIIVGSILLGIAILAAVMFPIAGGVQRKGQLASTELKAHKLKTSIAAYFTEYRMYPTQSKSDTTVDTDKVLMEYLVPTAEGNRVNPRNIVFFSDREAIARGDGFRRGFHTDSKTLYDPWGNPYRVKMDSDLNGSIENPDGSGGTILTTVGVWSAGPDGDFDTWEDNVKTW